MTPTGAIKSVAVFVPPVGPLEPEITKVLELAAKVRVILAPMLARIEAGQPAFIEAIEEGQQLADLLPELADALKTYDKLAEIAAAYGVRLEAAQS